MTITVGVADMKHSSSAEDVIITHALGSCLGITVWDPVKKVGGMLHAMLPCSRIDPDKAAERPYMFVDTGVPLLFKEAYRLGAEKSRLIVRVAGGAAVHGKSDDEDLFKIGKRNVAMLRKLLWKNGILVDAEDVGGHCSRTMSLEVGTGRVILRVDGRERELAGKVG